MDRGDPDHLACRELLETAREPLVVPVPVLVEVEWLATSRLSPLAFDSVLASVADGGLVIRELDLADWARVRSLCRTYADLPLGLVDASVIVTAERLEERTIASLDRRHFSVIRPRHVPSLSLVPD
jgi:predicted nucleic acid-binding protein